MSVIIKLISQATSISERQVASTIKLFEEGATIPFISRYRKEMTGSLDEVQIGNIQQENDKFAGIQKRKETILSSIEEQGKLSSELKNKINNTWDATTLEDLYLPYKQKRKTRAESARKLGLEPLAKTIIAQNEWNILAFAQKFIRDGVASADDAIKGARDIIAEWVSENSITRDKCRNIFKRQAFISSKLVKGKEEEGVKYKDYFDFSEPLSKCPSHRLLAIRRGEDEGFLKVTVSPEKDEVVPVISRQFVTGNYDISKQVELAVDDSYKRLIEPSIENEFRASSKLKADEESIKVFAENLDQLLLAPPLRQGRVLAIDPGYRSGCKLVCLDDQGNLVHNETIFPHPPQKEFKQAARKISSLVDAYKIDAIAIGNGTAGRETESFIRSLKYSKDIKVFVVNEAGASIYSASPVAREEFPNYDVTVRGAVSIGRRLLDPLAELVKIDPKSIGVGQYQHDVDQKLLKDSLDRVVEHCVNAVGVDLNTASKHLLTYVSGLGPQLAQNIIEYRKENGLFTSRKQLKEVPRLGNKAYELAAGFLRIPNAKNPLDNSAVHPESYSVVEQMAKDNKCSVADIIADNNIRNSIVLEKYVKGNIGIPTLRDILEELSKPGRDPRTSIKVFEFASDIFKVEDLRVGMELPGIVTNITNFGAFVDVGVKQDGLVHISQLANKFVSNPTEVVNLNQHVKVRVLEVDVDRKRIQLTMKLS